MNYKLKICSLIFCMLIFMNIYPEVPVGLQNCGNTCFMNAALQCLYNKKDLTDSLLLSENKSLYKNGTLAIAYANLVHDISEAQKAKQKSIAPQDWVDVIQQLKTDTGALYFPPGHTGDASEVLRMLLDSLADSGIDRSKVNEYYGFPQNTKPKTKISELLNFIESQYLKTKTKGCIDRPGKGTIIQLFETNIAEGTPDLSGNYKYIPIKNLNACLEYDFKDQSEVEFTQYENETDLFGKKCYMLKIKELITLPKTLIFSLKRKVRTSIFGDSTKKLKHGVSFPVDFNIDSFISPLASKNLQTKYKLSGFVMHHGEGAHYTAYVNNENTWYDCNDSSISEVDYIKIQEIISDQKKDLHSTPTVLFYEQEPQIAPIIKAPKITVDELENSLGIDKTTLDKYLTGLTKEFKYKKDLTTQDLVNGINDQLIDIDYIKLDIKDKHEGPIRLMLKRLPIDRKQLATLSSKLAGLFDRFTKL